MRAVVFVFVDLSSRRGLCAKKSRRGTAIEKKLTGGRRRRERGAEGRARCVWWPRCEHCVTRATAARPIRRSRDDGSCRRIQPTKQQRRGRGRRVGKKKNCNGRLLRRLARSARTVAGGPRRENERKQVITRAHMKHQNRAATSRIRFYLGFAVSHVASSTSQQRGCV